jgi:hypothetical protein
MAGVRYRMQNVTNVCHFAVSRLRSRVIRRVCHEMHAPGWFDRAKADNLLPEFIMRTIYMGGRITLSGARAVVVGFPGTP